MTMTPTPEQQKELTSEQILLIAEASGFLEGLATHSLMEERIKKHCTRYAEELEKIALLRSKWEGRNA